jgi:hypothetical protein
MKTPSIAIDSPVSRVIRLTVVRHRPATGSPIPPSTEV